MKREKECDFITRSPKPLTHKFKTALQSRFDIEVAADAQGRLSKTIIRSGDPVEEILKAVDDLARAEPEFSVA